MISRIRFQAIIREMQLFSAIIREMHAINRHSASFHALIQPSGAFRAITRPAQSFPARLSRFPLLTRRSPTFSAETCAVGQCWSLSSSCRIRLRPMLRPSEPNSPTAYPTAHDTVSCRAFAIRQRLHLIIPRRKSFRPSFGGRMSFRPLIP